MGWMEAFTYMAMEIADKCQGYELEEDDARQIIHDCYGISEMDEDNFQYLMGMIDDYSKGV